MLPETTTNLVHKDKFVVWGLTPYKMWGLTPHRKGIEACAETSGRQSDL